MFHLKELHHPCTKLIRPTKSSQTLQSITLLLFFYCSPTYALSQKNVNILIGNTEFHVAYLIQAVLLTPLTTR